MPRYIARKLKDGLTEQTTLVVYKDQDKVHLEEGDEFVTIETVVEL